MSLKYNKLKIISFLLLPLVMLSSCKYNNDDDIAKEEYLIVVNSILEKQNDELKTLFADNISSHINNFQDQVAELVNFVTGDYVSAKYTGTGAEYTIDGFNQVRFLPMSACELYTTESKYFFSILFCSIDDFDTKNVGIWNLMVQRCEDADDEFISYSSYEEWMNSDKYRGITLV